MNDAGDLSFDGTPDGLPGKPPEGAPRGGRGEEIAPGVFVSPAGLRLQFSRGGGPGGQNVNKLNTKAELWITLNQVTGLSPAAIERLRGLAGRRITAADELHLIGEIHRTQEGNRREVFDRLRELIVRAKIEPKRRRKTRPSASARRKRLESKKKRSQLKAHRSGRADI
jgi:ribosome-associated protein